VFDCVLNQAPGASGGGDDDGQDVTHIVRPDWPCRSRVQSGADASLTPGLDASYGSNVLVGIAWLREP
jgi:hypothetical protein